MAKITSLKIDFNIFLDACIAVRLLKMLKLYIFEAHLLILLSATNSEAVSTSKTGKSLL